MHELNGTYIWHYVDNEEKIEGLNGDKQYLICYERPTGNGSIWHMQLAYWFKEGDTLTIMEKNGTPHRFDIKKDGFYIINDLNDGKGGLFFRALGVRYWTEINKPEINPEEVLTIV